MARGFFGAKASDPNAGNERERPLEGSQARTGPILVGARLPVDLRLVTKLLTLLSSNAVLDR